MLELYQRNNISYNYYETVVHPICFPQALIVSVMLTSQEFYASHDCIYKFTHSIWKLTIPAGYWAGWTSR